LKKLFWTFLVTVCVTSAALALSRVEAYAGLTRLILVPTPAPSGFNSANASSWVAGGHAGYNWQRGSFVFGFETDLQGTHLESSMNGGLTFTPPVNPFPADAFAHTVALIDCTARFAAVLASPQGRGCSTAPVASLTAM
jgi:opacity protein-like surface antigen